ncbi:unnamed protein product [Lactuca virosa]|uniref:Uncharacterized protein n=1 Tax=Lactuca virosa TaxID=75947 RepID=A0AAU9M5N9_9ASTR|nr:unnamed protein product [Lactuca virosa]
MFVLRLGSKVFCLKAFATIQTISYSARHHPAPPKPSSLLYRCHRHLLQLCRGICRLSPSHLFTIASLDFNLLQILPTYTRNTRIYDPLICPLRISVKFSLEENAVLDITTDCTWSNLKATFRAKFCRYLVTKMQSTFAFILCGVFVILKLNKLP